MKKIFTILALAMISVWSWATVSISINPNVIDFGTVYLDESGEAEPEDYAQAELNYTLAQYVYNVFIDTVGVQNPNCEFSAVADSGEDFWYAGDGQYVAPETTVWVSFYAIAAGDYQIKYHFYSWEDYNWETKVYGDELTVKVKVLPHQTTGMESVQKSDVRSQKLIRDGQVLIIRNGEKYDVTGAKVK